MGSRHEMFKKCYDRKVLQFIVAIYLFWLQLKRYVNFVTKFCKQFAVQGYIMHIKQR